MGDDEMERVGTGTSTFVGEVAGHVFETETFP